MMKMPVELLIIYFLKSRFLGKSWTSIAILCNPKMGLHCDLMNVKGHMNTPSRSGLFFGGRVGVEDENGDAPEKVEIVMTYTISRLRLFIKSNRTRCTCGLLQPTLPEPSCG